jgi:hypothetical protein
MNHERVGLISHSWDLPRSQRASGPRDRVLVIQIRKLRESIASDLRSGALGKLQIINDYFQFLRHEKKWWMLPIVMLLLLLGLLVLFTQGSPLAPFIYTIF